MPTRLLLLVPTSTYRAEAFVAAAKRLDVDLSIASEVPSALSHLHPVSLPAFDFSNIDDAADFMSGFAMHSPVNAVVAVDDQATLAAAAVAATLGIPHNSVDAVRATMDKSLTRERMVAAAVRTPWFRLLSVDDDPRRVANELPFPVVIKPLMMAASRGVIRADDKGEFTDAFARVASIAAPSDATGDERARRHILVESYIPGWEVAVEGIVTDGTLDVFAIFDKPDPLEGPYFPETLYVTPSKLSRADRDRVIDLTQKTIVALGLTHGPIHAELRGSAAGVDLIEIAARSIGGLCSKVLRFDGGLALEDIILRHALRPDLPVPRREAPAAGVMMIQAPRPGRFERVIGLDDARAVSGVDEVIISANPGREVQPLPEGFLYLGFIFARGPEPEAVERSLREAFATLDLVIRD